MLPEPHSTKQIEDAVAWSHETDGRRSPLTRSAAAGAARHAARPDASSPSASAARCSSSTGRRTRSRRTPTARRSRRSPAGGSRRSRTPATCRTRASRCRSTSRCASSSTARRGATRRSTAPDGRKRALYISSPIGLGHAQRDVAIARELRELVDGLEIDWLAQDPVTRVLEAEGERIHPGERAPGQRVAATSSPSRPSTTCTASRRWRRMDEILDQQLHGLPRRRARGPLRPVDRRRGVGARLLPAREPAREARPLRVADRLRRLAADARRRRARGVPDRRLQRRDGRAHRRPPGRCATARSSSATPTTSSTSGSARSCR